MKIIGKRWIDLFYMGHSTINNKKLCKWELGDLLKLSHEDTKYHSAYQWFLEHEETTHHHVRSPICDMCDLLEVKLIEANQRTNSAPRP